MVAWDQPSNETHEMVTDEFKYQLGGLALAVHNIASCATCVLFVLPTGHFYTPQLASLQDIFEGFIEIGKKSNRAILLLAWNRFTSTPDVFF